MRVQRGRRRGLRLAGIEFALNAAAVKQWGIYEIALNGPTNGNPFLDVQFAARFGQEQTNIEVDGFYDGDSTWKFRFATLEPVSRPIIYPIFSSVFTRWRVPFPLSINKTAPASGLL